VAGTKASKEKAAERARLAAIAAQEAAYKRRRRRMLGSVVGGLAFVGLVILIVALANGDDDGTDVDTAGTTVTTVAGSPTTEPAALESAAGKPCVAPADPPPEGAPAVPVKVGPPPTELVKEDLKVGDGAEVAPGATVTVNYIGVACSTGTMFDASYGREPATFPLDGVIKGWTDGIPGMKVGGQRLLGIPADQAYGASGRPPSIGPDEPLWFVVEILGVS
jgi:peptidylprolyl isomerase